RRLRLDRPADRGARLMGQIMGTAALTHAFTGTVLYLDYDRQGFDYPLIPFHVNLFNSDRALGTWEPG
ncbi:MAG TPA: hypothetical protein VK009_07505, partial [Chloroflexota bacterium]|nr:hypothetical protein [Chloroflexota bacterium]